MSAEEVTQEDRGVGGAIMDALWPILGGDMLPSDMWHDISEAVTTALATKDAENAELRVKVKRLRATLHHIAKQWPDSFAARHARAALSETQP